MNARPSPAITLILARADNGIIGRDNALPWHISKDLKRFKELTLGKPMIMGRKTFESLPGLLPGRRHIILTRDMDWHAPGADVVHSADEAIARANAENVYVIGGAEIYRLFLPRATTIELTEVHIDAQGDTFLGDLDLSFWRETSRLYHDASGDDPAFSFVTLKPKPAVAE